MAALSLPGLFGGVAVSPPTPQRRLPTGYELRRLDKLWPRVPPEENAAYYYMKGASLLKTQGAPEGNVLAFSRPTLGTATRSRVGCWPTKPQFKRFAKGPG